MGWNKPNEVRQSNDQGSGVRRSHFRVLVVWMVVLLAVGLSAWLFWPVDDTCSASPISHPAKQIQEVESAPASTAAVAVVGKETAIPANVKPDEHGILRYPGGLRYRPPNKDRKAVRIGVRSDGKEMFKRSVFKHHSERVIEGLLRRVPGQAGISMARFDDRFVKDFKESLNDPIEITSEDSPEVAEIKRAMIETKSELKARMAAGEDLAQIMTDTRKELNRLAQYRSGLVKQLNEIVHDPKFTDQDVDDFVTAANQMLEKEGMKPIKKSAFVKWNVKLDKADMSDKGEKK